MIPRTDYIEYDEELEAILAENEEEIEPSLTWKLDEKTKTIDEQTDGETALIQACYMILRTEFGAYEIFDLYGLDLTECYGMDMEYAQIRAQAQIREALLRDDRIEDVEDFEWQIVGKDTLRMSCTVVSRSGAEFQLSEVDINV